MRVENQILKVVSCCFLSCNDTSNNQNILPHREIIITLCPANIGRVLVFKEITVRELFTKVIRKKIIRSGKNTLFRKISSQKEEYETKKREQKVLRRETSYFCTGRNSRKRYFSVTSIWDQHQTYDTYRCLQAGFFISCLIYCKYITSDVRIAD